MNRSVREVKPWLDPGAAPHIHISRLTKRFDDQIAVNAVDLDVYRGELFALLGGSGCGKTTLLRMLAGFITPDEGSITIDGAEILALPAYARPVNMMFQSYALFPHMTVEDNVAFGLRRDGVAAPEIKQRVAAALELVQMGGFARRKPAQLSGGQRQRVALARSIVKRPKVLLLDEPLSALDRKLREATQFELVNIQEEVGITFVMVTHDQEEAMTMATRIAVMDKGRIVQVGTPGEVYDFPASRFVADFIGSVNLFDGRLKESFSDHAVIDCPEAGADLTVAQGTQHAAGHPLCVAVRPEKICIGRAGERRDTPNRLLGRIKDLAYLGNLRIFHVVLASGMQVKVAAAAAQLPEFSRDQEVELTFPPAAGIVLEA
jgi:putrescine transport system ATP-binding protein